MNHGLVRANIMIILFTSPVRNEKLGNKTFRFLSFLGKEPQYVPFYLIIKEKTLTLLSQESTNETI
jgi:hypothetical protein